MRHGWLAFLLCAACGTSPRVSDDGVDIDAAPAIDAPELDAAIDAADPDAPPADASIDADLGPPGDPLAALVAMPARCNDGYCWWRPTPHGIDYSRVFSTATDNTWLVGGGPPAKTLMSWDGHAWREHFPPVPAGQPTEQFPGAISGSGPNNMWVNYGTTAQHFDGTTWTAVAQLPENGNPAFNGVYAAPDGDAWITQSNGVLKHWQGGAFLADQSPCNGCFLGSIWGTSSTDLYMTTLPAGILHYDGTTFTRIYSGPRIAAWYQGWDKDVWISGADAVLLHWDGTTMVTYDTGVSSSTLIQSAGAKNPNDIWWVATGSSLQTQFIHWDGTQLTTTQVDQASYGPECCASINAANLVDGTIWLVGSWGAVWTQSSATALHPVISPVFLGTSMWGTSGEDMYFASGGEVRHWDGTQMTIDPTHVGSITGNAHAGVGGANELFAIKRAIDFDTHEYVDSAMVNDGASWTGEIRARYAIGASGSLLGIYAIAPHEAILLGEDGYAAYYHGGAWSMIDTNTTADLASAWGPDADHLYVVGSDATVLTWSRANPLVLEKDPTFPEAFENFTTVKGAGGTVWIAASQQLHAWKKAAGGDWELVYTNIPVGSLTAAAADDVTVISSGQATMSHWNGFQFVKQTYPSWRPMQTIYAPPGGPTFLSNGQGVIRKD